MGGGAAIRTAAASLAAAAYLAVAPAAATASVGNFGMAVQPDGKILVAGGSGQLMSGGHPTEFGAVARYDPDGKLDRGFGGGDGILVARYLQPFTALALQPDGRILLTSPVGQLSRLLPNGRFDPSFGRGGIAPPGALSAFYPTSVAMADDGTILVGGMTGYLFEPAEHWYGRLYRYPHNGMTSAWIGSMTTGDGRPGEPKSFLNGFVLGAGGKVVGAGTVAAREPEARSHAALARLLPPAGSGVYPEGPNPSFGGGAGLVTSNFFPSSGFPETSNALARDRGKLLIAGQAENSFLLARYNGDGTLDAGFGGHGATVTNVHGSASDSANAIVVQRGGKIVVAGSSGYGCHVPGCASLAVARYRPNGRLDRGFGSSGIVSPFVDTHAYGVPVTETAYGVANQSEGKILVGGLVATHGATRFFLRRYLRDGKPDRTFGDGGRVTMLPLRCRGSAARMRASGCLPTATLGLRVDRLETDQPLLGLSVRAVPWETLKSVHLTIPKGLRIDQELAARKARVLLDGSSYQGRKSLLLHPRRLGVAPRKPFFHEIEVTLSHGQLETLWNAPPAHPLAFRVKVEFLDGSTLTRVLRAQG